MLTNIAVFSYATAAVAFVFLSILLLTSWRGRLHGMMLTVACLLTALWALTVAYQVARGRPLSLLAVILEILRNAGWAVFLIMLLGSFRQAEASSSFRAKPYAVVITAFFLLLIFATIYFYWGHANPYGTVAFMIGIVGRVAMAVIGMILVEQLYRNMPTKERWGIKYLCLGVGGTFAYDFYLYSDAMLFRHVNPEIWAARGIVNALIVPLIAVSAARNPQWSLGISVSRRLLFHSSIVRHCHILAGHGRCRLLAAFFWRKLGNGLAGGFPVRRGGPAHECAVLRNFAFLAQSIHQQTFFL